MALHASPATDVETNSRRAHPATALRPPRGVGGFVLQIREFRCMA